MFALPILLHLNRLMRPWPSLWRSPSGKYISWNRISSLLSSSITCFLNVYYFQMLRSNFNNSFWKCICTSFSIAENIILIEDARLLQHPFNKLLQLRTDNVVVNFSKQFSMETKMQLSDTNSFILNEKSWLMSNTLNVLQVQNKVKNTEL